MVRRIKQFFKKTFCKKKRKAAPGGVTVFLTCMLMLFLSLVLACVEAVRYYAVLTEAECVVEMGLDSVFAEYNRALLERYDLFFIDTAYGGEAPSYERLEEHLRGYMEANLKPDQDIALWNGRDLLGMEIEKAEVTSASLATDGRGRDVKYQAVEYIRDIAGLELIEEIQNQYRTVTDYDMGVRNVEEEAEEVQRQIDGMPLPEEQLEDGSFVEAEIDNPADSVNVSRFKGILYLVTDNPSGISERVINPDNYVSHRECSKGNGPACGDTSFSVIDEILFGEYLLDKCSYFGAEKENGELLYEMEYILAGKNSDMENLKWVAGRLVMIREVANICYLYTDKTKVKEADLLAWGLAIVALEPDIQPLIKNSILFAWAYAESIQDVKILLTGGKVPLLKSKETWHLSLDHMLDYQNHLEKAKEGEGLDYAMYLRLLLLMGDSEQKTERFMDIIEMNVRRTEGNACFRMDGCIDRITAAVSISDAGGNTCHLIREYGYLNR